MKGKKKRLTLNQKKQLYNLLFISPWLIGFLVLFIKPVIETVIYSFHYIVPSASGMQMTPIGFDNYQRLFTSFTYNLNGTVYPFLRLMYESISGTLIEMPIIIIFSLLIAILLNQKFKGRGLVRTIFFLPIIFGLGVLANLSVSDAMSNFLASTISTQPIFKLLDIGFLFERSGIPVGMMNVLENAVVEVFHIISFSGVQILIFLAALQSINPTLYEVADIEGASKYESFWKITLPMIVPIIITTIVYTFVDVLYRSPITKVISDTAFTDLTAGPGLSSAISVIFLLLTMALLGLILALVRKGAKHYEQ